MIKSILELKNDTQVDELITCLSEIDKDLDKKVYYVQNKARVSKKEALEYCVSQSLILWAKVYLSWDARKYQKTILVQGKESKKLVLRLGRRLGKCLPGDVIVQDSKTGDRVTIKELYNRKKANIFSIDDKEKLFNNETNIIMENGIKKVYKLTTKSGRTIRATANHPFYTPKGYIDLENLRKGMKVAIAKNYKHTDPLNISSLKVRKIAKQFLNNNDDEIPKEIFKLNNAKLSIFISMVYNSNLSVLDEDGNMILRYKSVTVLKQIQSLLLRFGVDSSFIKGVIKRNKVYYADNKLVISKENMPLFVHQIGINERNVNDILKKRYNNKPKNKGNIIWDTVSSITFDKEEMTYDLTVPDVHNFVANDFITHNTECMCIMILWYSYTQANKGTNNQYTILIITPYESQVDLIFDRLHQLIDNSPLLKEMITRDIYHRIELSNGTIIKGLTASSKTGTGAASTRGEHADILILDEIDYMTSADVTNIYNIRNEAPERIKIIVSSTPSGKHEEFYKWCVGASYKYFPSQSDIDNFKFTNFKYEHDNKGNGWTEIYAPSIVNEELLKINPDTGITYLEEIKNELSELRYTQEVMAEFGEEELGVYQKKYLEEAVRKGRVYNLKYTTELSSTEYEKYIKNRNHGIRILGIDWDSVQAGTNMVCIELDKDHINEDGMKEPIFKVLFRIEIPRSDFTYANALDKIIKLNEIYNFDHIALDKGYGQTQLELLKKYGMENPQTGLAEKTVGYQFAEKIEVRDPYTHKIDKKPFKPFMVNNSVIVFEKGKIILNPDDKELLEQFSNYKIKSISSSGLPIYTSEDEHIVDALNLCLLSFEQNYGKLFKTIISTKVKFIQGITTKEENQVKNRLKEDKPKVKDIIAKTNTGRVVNVIPLSYKKRNSNKFSSIKRRSF